MLVTEIDQALREHHLELSTNRPGPSFRELAELPLVVLVGLTAVGKTSAVERVLASCDLHLLPNRRWIADLLVIPAMLRKVGQAVVTVDDRVRRFELTARYRSLYEGGIAHALGLLSIDTSRVSPPFLFDGLRGIDEVRWAWEHLPNTRFVALDAPDLIRLNRLLLRDERFDGTAIPDRWASKASPLEEALGRLPGVDAVFSRDDIRRIASATAEAPGELETVLQKAAIILEERRNYDSRRAADFLERQLPQERWLRVDTAELDIGSVARLILDWL